MLGLLEPGAAIGQQYSKVLAKIYGSLMIIRGYIYYDRNGIWIPDYQRFVLRMDTEGKFEPMLFGLREMNVSNKLA